MYYILMKNALFNRLRKHKIFCIQNMKINEAGKVSIMCFDKTGTLTEDGLDMYGIKPINLMTINGFDEMVKDASLLSGVTVEKQELLDAMASCHSLTKTYVPKEVLIGDPLDVKMFTATKYKLLEDEEILRESESNQKIKAIARPHQGGDDVAIFQRFDFSSALQRMSVIVKKNSEEKFKIFVKGSPEKISELCLIDSIPRNFHKVLEKYTKHGYRVLAIASSILEINENQIEEIKREIVEQDLRFLGFLIMENLIKPETKPTIDVLQRAAIKTIMVTGDNILTAISVARQANIIKPNQKVYMGDLSRFHENEEFKIVWTNFEKPKDKLDNDSILLELPHTGPDINVVEPLKQIFIGMNNSKSNNDIQKTGKFWYGLILY